jgi:hypothetical protein
MILCVAFPRLNHCWRGKAGAGQCRDVERVIQNRGHRFEKRNVDDQGVENAEDKS